MSIPSNPSNGDTTTFNGNLYVYQSAYNRWVIQQSKDKIALDTRIDSELTNFGLGNLSNVTISYAPTDSTVLSWDSDNGDWRPRQFSLNPLGAIGQKNESFSATTGQIYFTLRHFPIGDVTVYRNGIALPVSSFSTSAKTLTYIPANNSSTTLISGDEIIVTYNYGTSAALETNLNSFTDVDIVTNPPTNGQVLAWDSDNSKFVPSSTIQATNTALTTRINNLDSDLNARGSFYVQSTPPIGSANSGWVDTTNLRLHVWDVTNEVWTQITTS